jgi:hypothetical protein
MRISGGAGPDIRGVPMIDQQYDELTRRLLDDAAGRIENGPDNEDT